jgi:hypothetical protein
VYTPDASQAHSSAHRKMGMGKGEKEKSRRAMNGRKTGNKGR